jgi:hypothetical protein
MGAGSRVHGPIVGRASGLAVVARAMVASVWTTLIVTAPMALGQPVADRRVGFDIPAQPLGDALSIYSAATNLEILVDGGLVSGRRSGPVEGVFSAEAALRALLAGTGLEVRYTGVATFTLTPAPARPALVDPLAAPWLISPAPADSDYSAALQTAVIGVLCRQAETRPGSYRAAIQLWISPAGAVLHSMLLGSTGNSGRDAALARALAALRVDADRPPGLPQPVTVLIAPLPSAEPAECAPVARAGDQGPTAIAGGQTLLLHAAN